MIYGKVLGIRLYESKETMIRKSESSQHYDTKVICRTTSRVVSTIKILHQ